MKLTKSEAWALVRAVQIALDETTVSARPRLQEAEYERVEKIGVKILEGLNNDEFEES